ncbi:hypothetical protein [Pseudomonas putida]
MIDPQFLSIPELATRWAATERQILEHGAHLRLPLFFLFDGLAFLQCERWLMGHGAHDEEQELERKGELAAKWRAHLKRNAAGQTDEFSQLDSQQVVDLRKTINEYELRIEALSVLLEGRASQRRSKGVFGYLRLPPRTIVDLQEQSTIPFPHLAFNQAGDLLTLEPGITGKWKSTLSTSDLLIPFADIKAIEDARETQKNGKAETLESQALPKPAPRLRTQEASILDTIRALGYEPQSLPKQKPGKNWVPSEVWAILKSDSSNFVSQGVFDKAWGRLKKNGEIMVEGDCPPPLQV